VTTKPSFRIALSVFLAIVLLSLAPVATATPPSGHGGGGKVSCTQKTPGVVVDNTWAWGTPGSWGLPGQTLKYAIDVINYDAGCGSSTFAVSLSAPSGFSVSMPTSTIALRSASSGYIWANVTSPAGIANGDYPLTVTVQRSGASASSTSFYKVYSSDTSSPTLYWPNPGDGTTISGRSAHFAVTSSDDHAVKSIDLYIDNAYVTTTACDNVSYDCSLSYDGSMGSLGPHTATFRSTDWMGNVGVLSVSFTVG